MKCQGIRREISIDPQRLAPEVEQHLEDCGRCRRYLDSMRHNDAMLRAAFAETAQPALQERLIAEAGFSRSRRRFALGLAAGFAALSAPGIFWLARSNSPGEQSWARAMLEHLHEDPQHLYSADPMAPLQLDRILGQFGAERVAELPNVLRAGQCKLNGHPAAHLVFEVRGERAVSFLVGQPSQPASFDDAPWCAELRGLPGATLGVFAANRACVDRLANALSTGLTMHT